MECMHFQPVSKLVLPPGGWQTLLDFLEARFPSIPRPVWADRLARGMVAVDGAIVGGDAPYVAGALLAYRREVADEPRIPFEETIVYCDQDIVVADKPHFLPVMPAGRHVEETLSVRLARRLGNPDLVALHRLDRDTAGLVVFSARPSSRDAYTRLFRERRIAKVYEAIAAPLRVPAGARHVHRAWRAILSHARSRRPGKCLHSHRRARPRGRPMALSPGAGDRAQASVARAYGRPGRSNRR